MTLRSDRSDALAGATAYLEMLAVTTAGQGSRPTAQIAAARSADFAMLETMWQRTAPFLPGFFRRTDWQGFLECWQR